jgi:lipopolysaccharide assembly outer membrane protein LptD (OstA)
VSGAPIRPTAAGTGPVVTALAAAALLGAWVAVAPGPALAELERPEPPFRITADNLTGGRGPEGDVLFLNGNLRVTRGGTVLTSDNGRYARTTGLIDLTGHVRLVDSTTTVTCDHASFSENDNRLNLDGNVVIVDREATLKSPTGWYDRKRSEAHASGGVTGSEKKQRLVADEATYMRDSMIVMARGHVQGWDDENKLELDAKSIDFFRRTKIAVATGDPEMRTRDADGRLTVLRAMLLRVNSDAKLAEAVDSVRVERDTLHARADYARFDDGSGQGLLLGSPRAWDNETTVTGDTLETVSDHRKLRSVIVRGNANMNYAGGREANAGETSHLSGARVDAFVDDNRIDSLMATGRASNDYTAASRPGRTNERNLASGDTILVYFSNRKIDRARVQGSARGEYRPSVERADTLAIANEGVRYDGRHIDFVVPKNKIVLYGLAHLTYRELELNAKRVEFDSEKQTLVARGSPRLLDRGDKVDGRTMTYDLGSRVGTIYEAKTAYEKGIYRGDRIRKVGENELDVMNGSYSTCDLDHPHYHFAAHWMKIYLKDKLVAKPVVFYLRNVPVLALPFYVFPIKPGRHSGFLFPQFEFGFNNRSGQFLRNAGYYWAPNDYMDLTLAADYYQAQPDYALRGEGNYKRLYAFDGQFSGRFEHNDQTKRDDYVFDGSHTQTLTPRTRLIARGNFVSSRQYNTSVFSGSTLEQRLNRFLTSSFSISHSADWASFNLVADRRQDLDADLALADPDGFGPLQGPPPGTLASLPSLTVNAPSLSVQFPSRTLGSYALFKDTKAETALASTYLNVGAHFLSFGTQQAVVKDRIYEHDALGAITDSTTTLGQRTLTRRALASNFSISDARRAGGWLNLSPGVFGNAVVFDFDEQGHKVVPAATWAGQLGVSTTYYGTFKPPIPHLAGLRHVIFPSLGFNFSPDFPSLQFRDSTGVLRNRFNGFGGIGISGAKNASMNFSLDQRFQVKIKNGDKITRLDNLLGWTTSGSYDFLWREHHLPHGLSPLGTQMTLQPPGFATASLSAGLDAYQGRPLRTLGFNTGINVSSSGARKQPAALAVEQTSRKSEIVGEDDFRETWRLSLAYSYSGGYGRVNWSAQKTANGVVSYQMTPNWQFDYSAAYDVTRAQILSQRFSLARRIHCWDAVFTRSFVPGGEAEYYFRLGVRDQKEIYFERGTRAQSFGGIQ